MITNTNDHSEQSSSSAEPERNVLSTAPERIVADSKDWTWVLTATCPDCQLTAADVDPKMIADRIPGQVRNWRDVLSRPDIATRTQPDQWSELEYACHVRDVYGVFTTRTRLLLNEQNPTFAEWDQDDAAVADKYWEQEPGEVARNLAASAAAYASLLHEVPDDAWDRVGLRSNGSEFTLATLTQYFLHDVTHHLWDVNA